MNTALDNVSSWLNFCEVLKTNASSGDPNKNIDDSEAIRLSYHCLWLGQSLWWARTWTWNENWHSKRPPYSCLCATLSLWANFSARHRKFYAGTGYESNFAHGIKKFMRKITSITWTWAYFIQVDVYVERALHLYYQFLYTSIIFEFSTHPPTAIYSTSTLKSSLKDSVAHEREHRNSPLSSTVYVHVHVYHKDWPKTGS